jgi:hypothetical protein
MSPVWTLSRDEAAFIVRWLVANVIGWGLGLALGGGLILLAGLAAGVIPLGVRLGAFPVAGALTGVTVGYVQWAALFEPDAPRRWMWASALGGALAAIPAGGLWGLLTFDPLAARLAVGVVLAAGVALGQATLGIETDSVWRTAYRWALMNGLAGMFCAGVAPIGTGAWLALSCFNGTLLFGAVTGLGLLWYRRVASV